MQKLPIKYSKMPNNAQAQYIRLNHRVLDTDGDNYIWFYNEGSRWRVEFGYFANKKLMTKYYSCIDNLLEDYPYEPIYEDDDNE